MTMSSSVSKVILNGDGVQTSFPFSFKVWKAADLEISITNADGDVSVVSNWTVVLAGQGGTVTYPTTGDPLPSGHKITIRRSMDFLQDVDLVSGTRWDPEVVETTLDQATAERQQLKEEMDRALKLDVSDTTSPAALLDSIFEARDTAVDNAASALDSAERAEIAASTVAYYNHEGTLSNGEDTIALPWAYDTSVGVEVFLAGVKQTESSLEFTDTYTVKLDTPVSADTPFEVVASAGATSELGNVLFASGGSASVGFLQAGTGAVARTLQDKGRDWVSVKDFGAVGDGVTDDTEAIQAAIDSIAGGSVFFPAGMYVISEPIQLKRGVRLIGCGPFDDTPMASAQIYLASGSDCAMVQTPAATDGASAATHYMAIESLCFNGNKDGQSTEVTSGLVQFHGVWVGSYIRDVFIKDTLGPSLTFDYGSDVFVDNVWVKGCQVSSGYAIDTNMSASGTTRSGLLRIGSMYIENISNKTGGDPRNVEADRGKAIRLHRLVTATIYELHIEGSSVGVDLESNHVINIDTISAAFVGDSALAGCGLVRHIDTGTRSVSINSFEMYQGSVGMKFVSLANGLTSNNIQELPIENTGAPYAQGYSSINADGFGVGRSAPVVFSRLVGQQLVGGATTSYYRFYNNTLAYNHFIKHNGGVLSVGSNWLQPSSTEKEFFSLTSYGNAADTLAFNAPLSLGERVSAASISAKKLWNLTISLGYGVGPMYQRVAGSNDGADFVVTARRGAGAPSINADYLGQVYIDVSSSPRQAYISTNTGSGAGDWRQITS